MRSSSVHRKTKETDIQLSLKLDGNGSYSIETGIGFFNHMLELFAYHAHIDLSITAKGDISVDDHHTVEDVGIALGSAFREALGDRHGIQRFGAAFAPMDETLARCVVDFGGRSAFIFHADFKRAKIGDLSTEMIPHFFQSFAEHAKANLHLEVLYGSNTHHKIEALFKAFALSCREAIELNPTVKGIPSTKGLLEISRKKKK
ncbi:MAG: imidazoleglycerol-phosphate dehydratase HisB [Bacteroidota bacterium]